MRVSRRWLNLSVLSQVERVKKVYEKCSLLGQYAIQINIIKYILLSSYLLLIFSKASFIGLYELRSSTLFFTTVRR